MYFIFFIDYYFEKYLIKSIRETATITFEKNIPYNGLVARKANCVILVDSYVRD